MGYFFTMTWMWWLLAVVLAVVITWAIFRERKHKDTRDTRDKHARGRRDQLANDGDEERARLSADAERTRADNPGVNIPGQHASLKEQAEGLKEEAETRTGRRKFF